MELTHKQQKDFPEASETKFPIRWRLFKILQYLETNAYKLIERSKQFGINLLLNVPYFTSLRLLGFSFHSL